MLSLNVRILLVVSPEQEREGKHIRDGLVGLGHQVSQCTNAHEALRSADEMLPDAVVSTALTPPLDAIELCWAIRKTSRVPAAIFVILAESPSSETRINGYRTGVDLFVSPPVSIRELAAYLESQLALRTALETSDLGLAGNLAQLGVLDILQLLANHGKSGRVDLWSDEGAKGVVYVRKGDAIHAQFGENVGRKALLLLAKLSGGSFRFFQESRFPQASIAEPASQLILDLARELDEEHE